MTPEPVLFLENSFSPFAHSTPLRGLPDREKELNGQSTPLCQNSGNTANADRRAGVYGAICHEDQECGFASKGVWWLE